MAASIVKVKGKADLDQTDRVPCVMLNQNLNVCLCAYNTNSKRMKLKLTHTLRYVTLILNENLTPKCESKVHSAILFFLRIILFM